MAYGFRVGPERPSVDRTLVQAFARLPVACVSDVMMRVSAGGARLRPLGVAMLAGPAITVKAPPGDNLFAHKAMDLAQPGDVIVIDAGGDLTNAIVGERMIEYALSRKIAGFVVNGAVRDVRYIRSVDIPVFAAGVTHRGPYKNGPGEINYPIAIDGMVIESGDLILGDEDGLLCVPFRDAQAILPAAIAKAESEQNSPVDADRSWIDQKLLRMGCEMPDRPRSRGKAVA